MTSLCLFAFPGVASNGAAPGADEDSFISDAGSNDHAAGANAASMNNPHYDDMFGGGAF